MFDEFAARITVDLRGSLGSETQGLLSKMVPDLQEIGQVFGNLGHAILNFASDMPGLAEVLLKIVDALSGVILWLSSLPHWLIEGAMGLEEFYRWGGLAATIIAKIGMLLPSIAGASLGIVAGLWSRLAGNHGVGCRGRRPTGWWPGENRRWHAKWLRPPRALRPALRTCPSPWRRRPRTPP